jgi:LPS sulfotransferase NodH
MLKFISDYRNIFVAGYLPLFGTRDYQRFLIVAHPRTGSNLLLDALATSSEVAAYGEIFARHRRKDKDFAHIFVHVLKKHPRSIKAVGFKLLYSQFSDQDWEKFLEHKEFKIIHLLRKNRLRTFVSLKIANKTRQWLKDPKRALAVEDKAVSIDASRLIAVLEYIEQFEISIRSKFLGWDYLEIYFEDLVNAPKETLAKIGEFLHISETDPEMVTLKRQNPEPLSGLIKNYDEIADLLRKTPFQDYLDG